MPPIKWTHGLSVELDSGQTKTITWLADDESLGESLKVRSAKALIRAWIEEQDKTDECCTKATE
jgi:hypothetical protein